MERTGRSVSNSEARLILNGWRESEAQIRVEGKLFPIAFRLEGRVVDTSGDRVNILSKDILSGFSFTLRGETMYVDTVDSPAADSMVCGLVFLLPPQMGHTGQRRRAVLLPLRPCLGRRGQRLRGRLQQSGTGLRLPGTVPA